MSAIFDSVATEYDKTFSYTKIGRAQRDQVWKTLNRFCSPTDHVLEINCGTGVDAIYLAKKVKHVLATDQSPAMISVCQKKSEAEKIHNCNFSVLSIEDLEQLSGQRFDMIFSNFGGLNCLSPLQLSDFSKNAFDLLKPGGKLVMVYIAKKCLWERFYFWIKQDKRLHRRSQQNGYPTVINDSEFYTYYYSTQELNSIFKPYLQVHQQAIGLFVPPGFLEKRVNAVSLFLLQLVDRLGTKFQSLANFGDHCLLIVEKP